MGEDGAVAWRGIAMAAVWSATVCGNTLVLRALARAAPRAPAHYLLASLATADLLLGLTAMPITAVEDLYRIHIERVWCACWRTLDVLCSTASILSLCALGWERHAGVTRPLARARRDTRARLVALAVWPLAAAVAAPAAFVPFHHHRAADDRACEVNTNLTYVVWSVSCSFWLPAAATLLLYWRVLQALGTAPALRAHRGRSNRRDTHCTQSSNPSRLITSWRLRSPASSKVNEEDKNEFRSPRGNHLSAPWYKLGDMLSSPGKSVSQQMNNEDYGLASRQVRATRTIVLLMMLFLVCWTPFFVVLPTDAVCDCVSPGVLWTVTWLGYANSAVNPLVYAATSPALRRALGSDSTTRSTRSSDLFLTPTNISGTSATPTKLSATFARGGLTPKMRELSPSRRLSPCVLRLSPVI